ncbi:MAG: prepilin-type N-terminal cleavage/methylation domain-containing protein [Geopsychrobacter sp.]|nr:prepilin-type N-terminal cleavage/methylation domain-containing protein [Geopsychrobacter sp.]
MLKLKTVAINNQRGFTLIELMVAMVLTTIIGAILTTSFISQQRIYTTQGQVVEMQQNIRAAMAVLAREIMLAGYDPENTGAFGIVNISQNKLTFTIDKNGNGVLDADETITYDLFDAPVNPVNEQDGILDLGRDDGGGFDLVAESINSMAFAYAFDDDGDGVLDTLNGQTVWAIDSDGDGSLDTTLDTSSPANPATPDGLITLDDVEGGVSLGYTVPITSIRAVKIWILARTKMTNIKVGSGETYVVGDRHISPAENSRHRLLATTILCRNT